MGKNIMDSYYLIYLQELNLSKYVNAYNFLANDCLDDKYITANNCHMFSEEDVKRIGLKTICKSITQCAQTKEQLDKYTQNYSIYSGCIVVKIPKIYLGTNHDYPDIVPTPILSRYKFVDTKTKNSVDMLGISNSLVYGVYSDRLGFVRNDNYTACPNLLGEYSSEQEIALHLMGRDDILKRYDSVDANLSANTATYAYRNLKTYWDSIPNNTYNECAKLLPEGKLNSRREYTLKMIQDIAQSAGNAGKSK